MKKASLFLLIPILAVAASGAGSAKAVGKKFPHFAAKDLVSGHDMSLSAILARPETKGAVVFFTSYESPEAVAYEGRINDLAGQHKDTIPFLGLNPNAGETAEKETARAKEKESKAMIAMDHESKTAKEIGAERTPEFYLLDKSGMVAYHGPLDDNQDTAKATKHYLSEAIGDLIAGKPIPADRQEIVAHGAPIKWPVKKEVSSVPKTTVPAAHKTTQPTSSTKPSQKSAPSASPKKK